MRYSRTTPLFTLSLATLYAGLTGVTSPPSVARAALRTTAFDFDDAMSDVAELTASDVNLIKRNVQLDDSQQALVDGLYEGYSRQCESQDAAQRDLMSALYKKAREGADRKSINEQIRSVREHWTQLRIRRNSEFFQSIKALLSEQQLKRWRLVDRDRRRRIWMTDPTRFAAENVDLIDIAESLHLDSGQRDAIEPALNAWADELDPMLSARRAAQDQWKQDVERPRMGGHPAEVAVEKSLRDRLDQRCRAIRELNLRSASLVTSQLASPDDVRFRSAFDLTAYPIIYRATPADHYLDKALARPDLTNEQTTAIEAIQRCYDEHVLAINDQLALIMRRQEDANPDREQMKREAFEQAGGVTIDADGNAIIGNLNGVEAMTVTTDPMPGRPGVPRVIVPPLDRADPSSPQGQLEKSKADLVVRTIESVFAVLNPDQQAAAPKPTAKEMLSPEEKMRRVMEKAFRTAKVTHNTDGSITFELHIEDDDANSPEP